MVLDLGVVDHAAQGERVEADHVLGGCRVLRPAPDHLGGGLDLGDHVAGEEARAGSRIGERLVLLVQTLSRRKRSPRGEAVEAVRVPLEAREVVEELRLLTLLGLLELRDLAGLARHGVHDGLALLGRRQALAAQVAAGVAALARGLEARLHEPVWLRHEVADLLLAARHERERRRLHSPERHGAVERGAQPDRRRARGVHPDEPVGLGSRAGRLLERRELLRRAQVIEGLADRRLRHRREPQPLYRLPHRRQVIDVREDQLALAAGVAGVDDRLDIVVRHQPVDRPQLLARPLVVRDQLELVREDREVGVAPFLELRVVLVGRRKADQVAHRPGDDVAPVVGRAVLRFQVRLVLRLLEESRERRREIARDGWLLSDY